MALFPLLLLLLSHFLTRRRLLLLTAPPLDLADFQLELLYTLG